MDGGGYPAAAVQKWVYRDKREEDIGHTAVHHRVKAFTQCSASRFQAPFRRREESSTSAARKLRRWALTCSQWRGGAPVRCLKDRPDWATRRAEEPLTRFRGISRSEELDNGSGLPRSSSHRRPESSRWLGMYAHRGCVGVYEYPEVGLKNDVLVDPFPPLCEATKSSPPPGVLYRLPPQRRSYPRAVGASPCVVSE